MFISSDYGAGGGCVEIKPDIKAQEIWFSRDMRNHHSSSVLIGDHLYVFVISDSSQGVSSQRVRLRGVIVAWAKVLWSTRTDISTIMRTGMN